MKIRKINNLFSYIYCKPKTSHLNIVDDYIKKMEVLFDCDIIYVENAIQCNLPIFVV